MKKLLLTLAVMTTFSTVAMAQDFQQYVAGKGVFNRLTNKFEGSGSDNESKSVAGLRLAYGLAFPAGQNQIRTELEYGFNGKAKITMDGDKSETKSQTLMANFYYDFNTGSNWTPYVGAGLGYARVKNSLDLVGFPSSYHGSESKGNFAWNVGAGVSYAFNENLKMDIGYRFTDYGKVEHTFNKEGFVPKGKVKLRGNELNIGIRYTFPQY